MTRLLLVDDDRELSALLADFLSLEGFSVDRVHTGDAALTTVAEQHYGLIVLDIMLPGTQGLDVLRQLRERRVTTPIIMLTARGDDTDRIVGLELGADDYLPKPCNPRELSARIRAVLRRATPTAAVTDIDIGPVHIVKARRTVLVAGNALELTGTEFDLLSELAARCDEVVSKELLCEQVLKRELTPYDRSVDMHVSNLRRKLAARGAEGLIHTVRGVGYRLSPPVESQP